MSYIKKKQWLDSLISSEEDQEKKGNLTQQGIGYLNGLKSARKMIFEEDEKVEELRQQITKNIEVIHGNRRKEIGRKNF